MNEKVLNLEESAFASFAWLGRFGGRHPGPLLWAQGPSQ